MRGLGDVLGHDLGDALDGHLGAASRAPSAAQNFEGARFQGKRVAEIAIKLHG